MIHGIRVPNQTTAAIAAYHSEKLNNSNSRGKALNGLRHRCRNSELKRGRK
jgi:hypothetical protein